MVFNFKDREDCVIPEHRKCLFSSVNHKRIWWTRRDTSATVEVAKSKQAVRLQT